MGTNMHASGFGLHKNNFSKWDHNTFVEQKSQIDWCIFENEYYWTNNLMFDMQTQPWTKSWEPMPGSKKAHPKVCMIYADTISGEVLPSKRVQFVEYNMHYRNPKFYTMLNDLNVQGKIDNKIVLNYMPLIYTKDSAAVSREANIFDNSVGFPYWNAGNNTENTDPQWADARIYTMSDNFVKWTKPATMVHAMNYAADKVPLVSSWTQYFWDPDGDVSNNLTWPLFNGVYNNPALLIGSIEGLPLGDLNWYPESKALWEKNKTRIDDHMRNAIEGKLNLLTGFNSINISEIKTACYPNPFSSELTISYTVKDPAIVKLTILSLTGRTVIELVNQSELAGDYKVKWNGTNFEGASIPNGIYLYRLQIGNEIVGSRIVKN